MKYDSGDRFICADMTMPEQHAKLAGKVASEEGVGWSVSICRAKPLLPGAQCTANANGRNKKKIENC